MCYIYAHSIVYIYRYIFCSTYYRLHVILYCLMLYHIEVSYTHVYIYIYYMYIVHLRYSVMDILRFILYIGYLFNIS